MRIFIIAKLILLTAVMASPIYGHVLMPMSYEKRKSLARTIVIAEIVQDNYQQKGSKRIIEFRVLAILKGQMSSVLKVSRSTMIDEERLTCCKGAGRYILFLRRGRSGLYESVNGDYGIVRLAE